MRTETNIYFQQKQKKKGNKKKGRCVKPLVYNCRYSVRQYSASSANNCREIQEIACAGRATFLSPEPDRDLIFWFFSCEKTSGVHSEWT